MKAVAHQAAQADSSAVGGPVLKTSLSCRIAAGRRSLFMALLRHSFCLGARYAYYEPVESISDKRAMASRLPMLRTAASAFTCCLRG